MFSGQLIIVQLLHANNSVIVYSISLHCSYLSYLLVITVGFERNFTAVDEDIGLFELCVRIFNDPSLLPMHTSFSFSLDLQSQPGTAGVLSVIPD